MPRRIVQDIVPPENRSIRNIPIDVTRRDYSYEPLKYERGDDIPKKHNILDELGDEPVNVAPPQKPKKGKKSRKGTLFLTFLVIVISVSIIVLALSLIFAKASVIITPKKSEVDVTGTYTAKKEGSIGLTYIPISVSMEKSGTVAAQNGPKVDTKAKGKVYLYNNHSATPQKIVATTRLMAENGKVYRTDSTVTIPGRTVSGGRQIPGSVEVSVTADMSGAEYNLTMEELKGDFKIVAYKGTDKYDTFYARMSTDIKGGFSGYQKVVDPTAKKTAEAEIVGAMQEEMMAEIREKITDDYIWFDGATIKSWSVSEPSGGDADTAVITAKGTITALTMKKDELAKALAPTETEAFINYGFDLPDVESLGYTFINSKDFSPSRGDSMSFSLKGAMTIVGSFDEEKLKSDLKGLSLSDARSVFTKYGTISNVHVIIKPFWKRSLPNDTKQIIIEKK